MSRVSQVIATAAFLGAIVGAYAVGVAARQPVDGAGAPGHESKLACVDLDALGGACEARS